jgi:hypothetical protein
MEHGFYTNFEGRSWQIPQGDDSPLASRLPLAWFLRKNQKKNTDFS